MGPTSSSSSSAWIGIDEEWKVFPLYLVRLADDTERVEILSERWQRRTFRVVELPHDYAGITTPALPVFLYRFTAALPDGDIVWRYTSRPTDATVSGSTWLASGIEHTRLSRSARLGGTVSVAADYDNIEPLKLCIPPRIAVPLKVEILKTTTALGTPETLFVGTVRKPELDGRKITITATEWGDVLEQKLPAFFIQRDCNYRVYDQDTCRANKTAQQVAVSITSSTDRTVTIQGSGLSGKAANWFSHGWIEFGSGLDRCIRFITQSTAASGNTVTLTVNQAITDDLPVSATIVPGCDGKRNTCLTKFGNEVNFGGHETPRDNLVFDAIRTQTKAGKK